MKTNNIIAGLLLYLIPFVGYSGGDAPTNGNGTLLKRKTVEPSRMVLVRNKDGSNTNEQCILVEETHSAQTHENAKGQSRATRTKVALIRDQGDKNVIWTYWPPVFPLSYDFKVATGSETSIVVFAKNYFIGVVEPIERQSLPLGFAEAEQPKPHFIDLKEIIGEDAFAPDKRVMNALTRNLRIEHISFDKIWHITIRGKGGKLYEIVGRGTSWSLSK